MNGKKVNLRVAGFALMAALLLPVSALPSTRSIAGAMAITDILKIEVDESMIEFTIAQNVSTIAFTIASGTATTGGIVRFIAKLDKTTVSFMIGDAGTTNVVSTDAGNS